MRKIFPIFLAVCVAFFTLVEISMLLTSTPKDKAIAFGFFTAMAYTAIFGFLLRKQLSTKLAKYQTTDVIFALASVIGSTVVETSIWLGQQLFQAKGAAISSSLLLDLAVTLPYYFALGWLFAKVTKGKTFSLSTVVLFAAVYEAAADGILGNLLTGNLAFIALLPLALPQFMVIYAPIIVVPYVLLRPTLGSTNPLPRDYIRLCIPMLAVLVFMASLLVMNLLKLTL